MTPAAAIVSAIGAGAATETATSMKVCVTGATGFLGAHVAAQLAQRGDEVRVTVRDRRRLRALDGPRRRGRGRRRARPARDAAGAGGVRAAVPHRRHGRLASPQQGLARERGRAPDRGRGGGRARGRAGGASPRAWRRSGPPRAAGPATERNPYPAGGTGLLYTDSKHEGERGRPRSRPSGWASTSCRCVPPTCWGRRYNRGAAGRDLDADRRQLPARPAARDRRRLHEHRRRRGRRARGTCWRPSAGRPGERYILGGENLRWSEVIERIAQHLGRAASR